MDALYGRVSFTKKELAYLFGVSPKAIQNWRDRGHLTPVGYKGKEALYDYWEAVAAEVATRHSPNLRVPRSRVIVAH